MFNIPVHTQNLHASRTQFFLWHAPCHPPKNAAGLQVAEHALSAVCNLAAGSAAAKAHLAEANVIPALLDQLEPTADAGLAQLAALSLRNLSKHPQCKRHIVDSGGVSILLDFLAEGLEVLQYPLRCEVRPISYGLEILWWLKGLAGCSCVF